MNNKPISIVISAPSGVGKTTLRDAAIEKLSSTYNLQKVVTTTTRNPRDGEVNGIDYIFLSIDDFNDKVSKDEFIEYTEVHGHFYGCLKETVDVVLESGFYPLIILDVVGKVKFDKVYPDNISIFLEPPSLDVIRERLESRNTDSEDINTRLEAVSREVEESKNGHYTFVVNNEPDLDKAIIIFCNLIEYIISSSQEENDRNEKVRHLESIYDACPESQLFLLIEGMTSILWAIDNKVEAKDITEKINKDYIEIKNALGIAIEYTKKFNVKNPFEKINNDTVTTSDDYQNWYAFWSDWKNNLTTTQWKDVEDALQSDKDFMPHIPSRKWDEKDSVSSETK